MATNIQVPVELDHHDIPNGMRICNDENTIHKISNEFTELISKSQSRLVTTTMVIFITFAFQFCCLFLIINQAIQINNRLVILMAFLLILASFAPFTLIIYNSGSYFALQKLFVTFKDGWRLAIPVRGDVVVSDK
jgi:hypothetical protein